ncbi:unnamed protein product [Arctia plantaginis]|uniref:Zinc finger PHD-type domain-containing protein n=1 Tax=Arctia plantaginis TaxID=874455 RepID=A0A8S1A4I4_ARCPL|nr:unnamed protein product [Arctia plantaginis]
MASIFTPAFHQAATTGRVVELFKCTGIVPWNPNIFTDVDFLASDVTEREDPEENQNTQSVVQVRSSLQISSAPLADLILMPKSTQNRSSNRKHKKSEVISSSPYKTQLEKENEQKNVPKSEPKTKKIKTVRKPKTNNKKKIWRCGGCNEVYKEPIVEDWIACNTCKEWWHENCSDYNGSGAFICNVCK